MDQKAEKRLRKISRLRGNYFETKTELMELIQLLKESKFRVGDELVGWVQESRKINNTGDSHDISG